jgi:hypothetical protein
MYAPRPLSLAPLSCVVDWTCWACVAHCLLRRVFVVHLSCWSMRLPSCRASPCCRTFPSCVPGRAALRDGPGCEAVLASDSSITGPGRAPCPRGRVRGCCTRAAGSRGQWWRRRSPRDILAVQVLCVPEDLGPRRIAVPVTVL